MAKTKKRGRPKQQHLPGMEPPRIKAIDNAADAYVEARNERQLLTQKEVTKRDTLMSLMQEHGLETYRYDGKRVELVKSDLKVKVRNVTEEPEEGDDEE